MNKEAKRQIIANLASWQFWLSRLIVNFLIIAGVKWFYYQSERTALWTTSEFLLRLVIYTFTSFLTASLTIIVLAKRKEPI